jgi:hypothetical protein
LLQLRPNAMRVTLLSATPLLLLLLLGLATPAAAARTAAITAIGGVAAITAPATPPACVPKLWSTMRNLLRGNTVLIVADAAADYAVAAGAHQFLAGRGANVTFARTNAATAPVLLDGLYYPKAVLAAATLFDPAAINDFDVVVVPPGYASTTSLRQSAAFTKALGAFSGRAIVVIGSGAEVLIESGWLGRIVASAAMPATTPPVEAALKLAEGQSLPQPLAGMVSTSAHSTATGGPALEPKVQLVVGANASSANAALALLARDVFGVTADSWPCTNTVKTEPIVPDPSVFTTIDKGTVYAALLAGTDAKAAAPAPPADLRERCRNAAGVDFCNGADVALVVTDGAHAAEVAAIADAFYAVGAALSVVCPDALWGRGHAYLFAAPPTVPSARIHCDHFFNDTTVQKALSVIVPGGVIATHGGLMRNARLLEDMDYTGVYAVFGTAEILMTRLSIEVAPADVPACPATAADLRNAGFKATVRDGAVLVRNGHKQRAKVMAGYANQSRALAVLNPFVLTVVESLVWADAPQRKVDWIVWIIVVALCAALGLVAVAMYQRKRTVSATEVEQARLMARPINVISDRNFGGDQPGRSAPSTEEPPTIERDVEPV